MKAFSATLFQRISYTAVLIDISALAFIYLVPTISHLISLPVYLIEPMRLMLIIALVHTTKRNAYILAVTLPLFSFLISSHPELPKMMLIAFELSLNVFLFFLLANKLKYYFPAILISIILSKVIYYIIKFGLIKLTFLNTELISTPISIQLITTVIYSIYLYVFLRKEINLK
ncbi:MAG: hypothetical protein HY951_16630 [Bacteroidia bacterium]|nr:hypothetical protein [Bacteroidia bacterium]